MHRHVMISLAAFTALLLPLLFHGGLLQPSSAAGAALATCSSGLSGCHFTDNMVKDGTARNVPAGRFLGSHARHSGYSTSTAKRQYAYACTKCHPSGAYTNAHQTGFKNITGSSLPGTSYSGGKKIPNTNSPAFGNCSKIYCHSNGRGAGMGQVQYSSAKWGGTETCLGCHGGRASATGAPARSVGNFTLTTTHSQHLKYPAANMNCQICHSKTTQTNAWTLKTYTAATHHVNGVRDVTFTDIAYASYTSYKTSGVNVNKCLNTSCHGGKTRGGWSASTQNTDHPCAHCHGTAGTAASTPVTGVNRYNLRFFAPGYKKTGTVGTSTDQNVSSTDKRVGSHFKHLSSAYMRNIKCNECHKVPSTPFSADTNHTLNTLRYNSATLDFSQSSSAKILIGVASGTTPAQLSAFAGYTNGTASTAATCSSVYCHGNRLKTGNTTGTYRKPYWNYSAMINYSDLNNACSRCHGFPPLNGTSAASHTGKGLADCVTCHSMVVNVAGKIINKDLHINGEVDGGGHAMPYGGSVHRPGGSGNPVANASAPYTNCNGCHDATTDGGTYPATKPLCSACHLDQASFIGASPGCKDCHGADASGRPQANAALPNNAFPNISGSHGKHVVAKGYACSRCHDGGGSGSVNHGHSGGTAKTKADVIVSSATSEFTWTYATLTCSSNACHGDVKWGGRLFCTDCHAVQVSAPTYGSGKTRRAITPEFGANWSHARTGGTVTMYDCGVCHMEGNSTTGATVSPYHGNGTIELRDADTGNQIQNFSAANFAFARFSTTFATKASANNTNNIDYIVAQLFCLKCHDGNGANSASARVSGGSALVPFGSALGAAYTRNGTTGAVYNAYSAFAPGNSSAHPIRGPRYNSYCNTNTMNAPYAVTKTGGTKSAGKVMVCWDCHNTPSGGIYTTRTIDAHGSGSLAVIMRGAGSQTAIHGTQSPTHCLVCHKTTIYAPGSGYIHGTGSAAGTFPNSNMGPGKIVPICSSCHFSQYASFGTTRTPVRSDDIHGFRKLVNGQNWPGTNFKGRPYGFIRNTAQFQNHRPKTYPENTSTTAACNLSATPGNSICSHNNMPTTANDQSVNYTPGGVY